MTFDIFYHLVHIVLNIVNFKAFHFLKDQNNFFLFIRIGRIRFRKLGLHFLLRNIDFDIWRLRLLGTILFSDRSTGVILEILLNDL